MTILNEIATYTKQRILREQAQTPLLSLKSAAEAMPTSRNFPFESVLAAPGLSFICEVKKASPSKGIIAEDFPYLEIAKSYEQAGAAALSVLTEPKWFLGSPQYLQEIAATVKIPVLRKDFTVDAYQIYEAKVLGASAILLICTILTDAQLTEFLSIADSVGLSVLTEVHDEAEVKRAQQAGARIIGVNNRDLKTFNIDTNNSARLRDIVSGGTLFVSESGISGAEDMRKLASIHPDSVLIGEAMMRAEDKSEFLSRLRSAYEQD